MKKITYTLLFLLVLSFTSFAQVTVLNEGFESNNLPTGWTTIDNDHDGNNWFIYSIAHTGSHGITSESFSSNTFTPLSPDNWLISPTFSIDGATTLTFFVRSAPDWYDEHYGVYIDPTGTGEISNFVSVFQETMTVGGQWLAKTIDLTGYSGTVRIAFRHFQCSGMETLSFDDVQVTTTPSGATLTSNVSEIDFGITSISEQVTRPIVITGSNLSGNITATTSAPFSVSSNGTNFGNSASANGNTCTFYVRYTATSTGNHNGTVSFSSPNATSISIPLHSNTNNCSTENLPFNESFEGTISSLNCWTIQADNANPVTISSEFSTVGNKSLQFSSENITTDYNSYIITPALPNNVAKVLSFDYRGGNYGQETFRVGYSSASRDLDDFVWGDDMVWSTGNGWISHMDATMPSNAKYFAIHYKSNHQNHLFIDNFSVEEIPACPAPSNLIIGEATSPNVNVSWTASPLADGTETYHLSYAIQGTNNWNTITTSNTSATINNVQERTIYQVKLQAVCANGESTILTGQFETDCFEGGDVTIGSASSSATQFPCFTNYKYSFTEQLYLASEVGVGRRLNSIAFQMSSNEAIDRNLNIYLMHTNQNSINGWIACNSAQLVYSGNVHFLPNSAWTTINFTTPFEYNGSSNLLLIIDDNSNSWSYKEFKAESISNMSRYGYSDDQNINPMTITSFTGSSANGEKRNYVHFGGDCANGGNYCYAPTITINNVADNAASISWTENGTATSWQIEYGPAGFAHGQGTNQTLSSPSFNIQGLNAGTNYDVYVRAICSSNEYSNWSYGTFTTTVGINDFSLSQTQLYPNPNNGMFTIHNSQCLLQDINIYDVYGKLVQSISVNDFTANINISNLANGLYFVRISNNDGMVTKSIVKK